MTISQKLLLIAKQRGLSAPMIETATGVHHNTINRIKDNPDLKFNEATIEKLCAFLGVKFELVMVFNENENG